MNNTLSKQEFINNFQESSRGKSFSYDALEVIYDEWTDAGLEYDPIAIDCEYSEMTIEQIREDYKDIETFEDLQDVTVCYELDNGKVLFNYNF